MIELTPEQSKRIEQTGGWAIVRDPASGGEFLLMPEEIYQRLQLGMESKLRKKPDQETLAALEEGLAQAARAEGMTIEEFRQKHGI